MALLDRLGKLTLGELAQVEELGGASIASLKDAPASMKMLTAMAYIITRRDDPSFTFSRAEALTMEDLTEITGGDEEDPKL